MRATIEILLVKGKAKTSALVTDCSEQRLKCFLVTCIVLLTIVKLSLIGTGFLAFPDEGRYGASGRALQYLSEFRIGAAIDAIFTAMARPGDAIVKTIPNAIQFITAHIFELNYYESKNAYPLFLFNYIVYCCILIVHYRFGRLVLRDDQLALTGVLLYSSLTNSYLYIRHALPYDASLLLFYLTIHELVKYTGNDTLSYRRSLRLGFIAFFAYLVYPGYFPLFIIGAFLLCLNNLKKIDVGRRALCLGHYSLGSMLCLVMFEGLSRLVGRSYIQEALWLSGTITQGSFEESFSFIVKYLFDVEFITGIFLMIALGMFCLELIDQLRKRTFKDNTGMMLLGIAAMGVYLGYASAGYFFEKVVLYGRLLHQYLPLMCIFAIYSFSKVMKIIKKREWVILALALVCIVTFGAKFLHYRSFAYPRDVLWEVIGTHGVRDIEVVCEHNNGWSVMPSEREFRILETQIGTDRQYEDILVVNGCYFHPVRDLSEVGMLYPKDNHRSLLSKPHFINFKGYQYEGYRIVERSNIDKMNLQIRVYACERGEVEK